MPNCFCLTRKGETQPMPLVKIDEMICEHFNEPVHPTKYFLSWYDFIGWKIAVADWDLARCVLEFDAYSAEDDGPGDQDFWTMMALIAKFLEENFTSDAWVQIGK